MKSTLIAQDSGFASRVKILIEQKYKVIICLFFAVFLCTGLSIFKDYGIPWDEPSQRRIGTMAIECTAKGEQAYIIERDRWDRYLGPAFEILLVAIEKGLNLKDTRTMYFMRHLVIFLFFYTGVIFFYLLCNYNFHSWKVGLLGSLFLILNPRIFAHSFYNSKDIPFLVMFIISIYTLIKYLDKKTLFRAFIHAFACSILIDIRILGIVVPFLTILFLIPDRKASNHRLVYMLFLILFTILFWPTLWRNPVYHFIVAFAHLARHPLTATVLYLGNYIKATNLPWHYIPIWIAISIPIVYILCFLIGCFIITKGLFKNPIQFYIKERNNLILLLWFFLPLTTVIVLKSVVYDAWRHMFFIYPAFLMISLSGLRFLFKTVKIKFQGVGYKLINAAFVSIIAFSLVNTVKFMVKNHPYQNIYFNILAGKNMDEVKNKFELDYWGLSYRKALEYILKNDTDKAIKIYVANSPGVSNAMILSPDDRNRLIYVKNPDEAKYFLSNYRWHKDEYPYKNEYYSIKIGGTKIMVVYRL